jgi:hypothetical protein
MFDRSIDEKQVKEKANSRKKDPKQENGEQQIDIRHKIRTELAETLNKSRESTAISQKNYKRDLTDKIVDITFTQDDKEASIKSVLPGEYTFIIGDNEPTHIDTMQGVGPESAYHDEKTNTVGVRPGMFLNDSECNLETLHEAGHSLDCDERKDLYTQLGKSYILTTTKLAALKAIDHNKPDEMKAARAEIAENKDELSAEEIVEMLAEFDIFTDEVRAMNFWKRIPIQHTLYNESRHIRAKATMTKEYGAWRKTVQAIVDLRTNGINTYSGTNDDLLTYIDKKLQSYEAIHRNYLPSEI